ncbi:MAG: Panacea domain-containing protein [Patescibacteria group bacterium]
MISTLYKKSTQALNYFSRKKDGQINKMKAIKLVYLADRYHIRKYGRPIIGDMYLAMKLGPVGSNTLNVANISENNLDKESLRYVKEFISHPKDDVKKEEIVSKKEVDFGVFSQTDIEALETIYKEFGDRDQFELAKKITHEYPEWSKFGEDIRSGKTRAGHMDYSDFFLNPKHSVSNIFEMSPEHLDMTKKLYQERQEVENILK